MSILTSPQAKAKASEEDCNGVTLHDGRFECRRGPQLIPSPKGNPCNESTWVITNAGQCHLNRTGVDRTGFATHALSLSMREGDTATAAHTRMRTVWQAGVTRHPQPRHTRVTACSLHVPASVMRELFERSSAYGLWIQISGTSVQAMNLTAPRGLYNCKVGC